MQFVVSKFYREGEPSTFLESQTSAKRNGKATGKIRDVGKERLIQVFLSLGQSLSSAMAPCRSLVISSKRTYRLLDLDLHSSLREQI